jgi:hypothetical protein
VLQGEELNSPEARIHSGRCDMLKREEGLTYKRDKEGCLLVGGGDVVL